MERKTNNSIVDGTSLAVRQFVALLRGEDVPHEPRNPWRVEAVRVEMRYCMSCCGERWFDVIKAKTTGDQGKTLPISIAKCRCCGAEV